MLITNRKRALCSYAKSACIYGCRLPSVLLRQSGRENGYNITTTIIMY